MSMKNWLKTTVASVVLCSSAVTMSATIDKVIVFGDSLSDNGNVYNMLAMAKNVIPLVPLIPKNPPYYEGRFSNGLVWVEHLAKSMNVPLVNYAYGGAWVEGFYDSMQILPPSLGTQIDMYSVTPSTIVDYKMHQHLYVIWAGANDYLKGRSDAEYATTNTVETIASQAEWLLRMGARKMVILNAPDLSRAPSVIAKGADFAIAMQKMVEQHNIKLSARLDKMRKQYPNANIVYIDVNEDFDDLIVHPEKYQLKNVMNACYTGGYSFAARQYAMDPEVQAAKQAKFELSNNSVLMDAYINSVTASKGQTSCANPDEYLFWDKTHPTRVAHQLISVGVFAKLAASGVLSA